MRPDHEREFDQNMNQLIHLLKKILKDVPLGGSPLPGSLKWKDSGMNLNICFFTFLPMTPETLDEWEELYDQYFPQEEKESSHWSTELSPADIEFLRRHGLEF